MYVKCGPYFGGILCLHYSSFRRLLQTTAFSPGRLSVPSRPYNRLEICIQSQLLNTELRVKQGQVGQPSRHWLWSLTVVFRVNDSNIDIYKSFLLILYIFSHESQAFMCVRLGGGVEICPLFISRSWGESGIRLQVIKHLWYIRSG